MIVGLPFTNDSQLEETIMKRKLFRSIVAATVGIMIAVVPTLQAQDTTATSNVRVGVSAAFQGDQTDLMLPLRLGERIVLVPSVGFVSVSERLLDVGIGLGIRINAGVNPKAVPYVGMRGAVLILDPDGDEESITDYVFGFMFGGEYFLDHHFSLGVEAQLNVAKSNESSPRFANPDGTNINTAALAIATFYF
jgi:hypothetical protein